MVNFGRAFISFNGQFYSSSNRICCAFVCAVGIGLVHGLVHGFVLKIELKIQTAITEHSVCVFLG